MSDCDWELKWQHINRVHSHVATLSLSAVSVPGLMNVQRWFGLKKSNCAPERSSSYSWWEETVILHFTAFPLALHFSTVLSKSVRPCDFNIGPVCYPRSFSFVFAVTVSANVWTQYFTGILNKISPDTLLSLQRKETNGKKCYFKLDRILLFELITLLCLYHNIVCIVHSEDECGGFS